MDDHKGQHGVVYIGTDLFRPRSGWYPAGGCDAVEDRLIQHCQYRFNIRLEKPVIDLANYIADCFGLFGQLDKERSLKVRDQLRKKICLEDFDIRECEKYSHILHIVSKLISSDAI